MPEYEASEMSEALEDEGLSQDTISMIQSKQELQKRLKMVNSDMLEAEAFKRKIETHQKIACTMRSYFKSKQKGVVDVNEMID